VGERRGAQRCQPDLAVAVAQTEHRLPPARTIDISTNGVLLAFEEPVGFVEGTRAVLSIELPSGHLHTLSTIRRVARGLDFRTYVALEFELMRDDEVARLADDLEQLTSEHQGDRDETSVRSWDGAEDGSAVRRKSRRRRRHRDFFVRGDQQ